MLEELRKPFRYPRPLDISQAEPPKVMKSKPRGGLATLKRIGAYLTESKWRLLLVLVFVVMSSALALLAPYVIGYAIDHHLVTGDYGGIPRLIGILALIYLLLSASLWLQNVIMITVAQHTVRRMRNQLFSKLHLLPIPYFDRHRHGELMSRITNDMDNVSSTLNSSFIQLVASVLTLVGTVGMMLYLSPLLTLLTLMVIPVMIYGMRWITRRTSKMFKAQQRHMGELNGYMEETMSGQALVKTFSMEQEVLKQFNARNAQLRQAGFWAQTLSGFIPKLMNGLNNLNFAVIAGVGGLLALSGHGVTAGTIIIFAEYARQFTRPLNDLANQFNTFLSAIAGAERVFDVLDQEEEAGDEAQVQTLSEIRGQVDFQQVSFAYSQGGDTLSDVTFSVPAGQTIALVGPTGAGKTTLINLLSRFYEPTEGTIAIDGCDVKKSSRASLRQHMAFVLQDSFLFQGTIRENIRYGRLNASDQEVEEAARQANAHLFIKRLPQQYDTVLSGDGGGISQGQKQLLAIARAILAAPTILVLDEATSSIDTVTEIHIQEALQKLMQGRTSFIIAHRLNTIQRVDQIMVLEQGRIVEIGSHEQLLAKQGYYHRLFHSQMQHTAAE